MNRVQCLAAAFFVLWLASSVMARESLFASADNYVVEGQPHHLVATHLDGDTYCDLAVVNGLDVLILLNNGDGTLRSAVYYHAGDGPQRLCALDLDGDGDNDLAVMNRDDRDISILLNNGDGTLQTPVDYDPYLDTMAFAALDLDGDGDNDLAVAGGLLHGWVRIMLNKGDGTFEIPPIYYDVGTQPSSIVAADLDGDKDIDLAIADTNTDVSILLNNGDATFQSDTSYSAGDAPQCIVAADLDGDGDNDLAVSNDLSYDVSILLNNGDATFQGAFAYDVGYRATSVFAGDLDGDSDNDLAVCGYNGAGNISVLMNNGDGTFRGPTKYVSLGLPHSIVSADLDRDGHSELAVAIGYLTGHPIISVMSNNGDGTFRAPMCYEVPDSPQAIFAADLDGDTYKDLAVVDSVSVCILINKGNAEFGDPVEYSVGSKPWALFGADFDGDGDNDLAVANARSGDLSLLLNNGDGTFQTADSYDVGEEPSDLIAVDLDSDTDLDLAASNQRDHTVSVLFNNGYGVFGNVMTYDVGDYPDAILAADLDHDSDNDLVVIGSVYGVYGEFSVLMNNGDGTFQSAVSHSEAGPTYSGADLADLDGDGHEDLAVTTPNDWVSILSGNGDGTFQTLRDAMHYDTGDLPQSVCAVDLDGDRDNDLAVTNFGSSNISILLNSGDGSFQDTTLFAAGERPTPLSAADFDGDGDKDLAVGNRGSNDISIYVNLTTTNNDIPLRLGLGILQNPYISQYLDIYLIGSAAIDPTSVRLEVEEQSLSVGQINPESHVWMADYKLPGVSTVVGLTACASDMVGNDTCITATFFSSMLCEAHPTKLSSPDGKFSINIDSDAGLRDSHLILLPCIVNESWPQAFGAMDRVTSLRLLALDGTAPYSYYLGPEPALVSGSAYVEFHYTCSDLGSSGTPDHLYIVQEGIGTLESYVDPVNKTVGAEIFEFGEFRLALGSQAISTVTDALYLRLQPSFPNPFSIGTTVRFEIRAPQHVRATVHDVTGRVVARLLDEQVYPGIHEVIWDGRGVSGSSTASGLYFIRLESEHNVCSGKIVRLR